MKSLIIILSCNLIAHFSLVAADIKSEGRRAITGPAANLFINSLIQAGVKSQALDPKVVSFTLAELSCQEGEDFGCFILFEGSQLLAPPDSAVMLLRVLRANGAHALVAQVADITCLLPSFPHLLGRCVYFIAQ